MSVTATATKKVESITIDLTQTLLGIHTTQETTTTVREIGTATDDMTTTVTETDVDLVHHRATAAPHNSNNKAKNRSVC